MSDSLWSAKGRRAEPVNRAREELFFFSCTFWFIRCSKREKKRLQQKILKKWKSLSWLKIIPPRFFYFSFIAWFLLMCFDRSRSLKIRKKQYNKNIGSKKKFCTSIGDMKCCITIYNNYRSNVAWKLNFDEGHWNGEWWGVNLRPLNFSHF